MPSSTETAAGAPATYPPPSGEDRVPCTLWDLTAYFLRLGTLGFGGPIALAGYMQEDLVDRRRWVTKEEYLQGLALAQLAPGPMAAQLAIYMGWVRGGVLGATVIGVAFVIPPFVIVTLLAIGYTEYGGLSWMQGAFYGIGASVIAIIVRSARRMMGMTIGRDRVLWAIFLVNAVLTGWTEREIVWVFLLSGLVSIALRAGPAPPREASGGGGRGALCAGLFPVGLHTGLAGPAGLGKLGKLLVFFTESGAYVFGSGLAIVPFLYGGVVHEYGWLTEQQFLDAVAVAMISPGPVVITTAFIGYLVGGFAGGLVASVGTFLPCYFFTIIPAPHFHKVAGNRKLKACVEGVTAAAVGAIGGAAFVLGRRAISDGPTLCVFLATWAFLESGSRLGGRKVPDPVLILATGVLGVLWKGALQ